jgi:large subunit ribosomal protein L40e/small subunit ribosomal protein S27Ae/ubiquitin C
MKQAVQTIRKAVAETRKLHETLAKDETASNPLALNQAVRWITVKEEHASSIIALAAECCLCQRVGRGEFEAEREHLQALRVHHTVMQAATKAKQSVDEKDNWCTPTRR